MILTPVFRASKLARAAPTVACLNKQARRRDENWRQKGDLLGHMSFAIPAKG